MRTRNDGDHMMMSQARMSKDDSCRRRLAAARPKCNSHQGEEADWCQGHRQRMSDLGCCSAESSKKDLWLIRTRSLAEHWRK